MERADIVFTCFLCNQRFHSSVTRWSETTPLTEHQNLCQDCAALAKKAAEGHFLSKIRYCEMLKADKRRALGIKE